MTCEKVMLLAKGGLFLLCASSFVPMSSLLTMIACDTDMDYLSGVFLFNSLFWVHMSLHRTCTLTQLEYS